MKTDPLATFAPWPATAEEATAEALIRVAAVRAHAAHALFAADHDAQRQLVKFTGNFVMAALLRDAMDLDCSDADEMARRLWARIGDGGVCAEEVLDWLDEASINPDDVATVAVDAYRIRAEEVAAKTAQDAGGQVGAR